MNYMPCCKVLINELMLFSCFYETGVILLLPERDHYKLNQMHSALLLAIT